MKNSAPSRGSGLALAWRMPSEVAFTSRSIEAIEGCCSALQSGSPGLRRHVGDEGPGALRMRGSKPPNGLCRRSGARTRRRARRRPRPAPAPPCRRAPPGPVRAGPPGTPPRPCCPPARGPSSKERVLAAPTARATAVGSSAASSARSLCGIVTFAPTNPCAGKGLEHLGEPLRLDVQRLVAPVEAQLAEGRVVHRRRAAVPDRVAQQRDPLHTAQHIGGLRPHLKSCRVNILSATCRRPRRAPRCSAAGRGRTPRPWRRTRAPRTCPA